MSDIFQKCGFCGKDFLNNDSRIYRLCLPGQLYCRFCLRHGYDKNNKDVLKLTMRSVFGYYFWEFYQTPPHPLMWISEIKDYIKRHEGVGLHNPIFNYDPETLMWFIDFNRVGDVNGKLSLEEVKETIASLFSVLNLHKIKGLDVPKFRQRFDAAIVDFYHKKNFEYLALSFEECENLEWSNSDISIEDTKNFLPGVLDKHLWNKVCSKT
jgi:hypothetical protein